MRRSFPTVLAALLLVGALALLAGCGSSSEETETGGGESQPDATNSISPGGLSKSCTGARRLRVTQVSCAKGRAVAAAWRTSPKCSTPTGASRYSCKAAGLSCLGVAADPGIVVSCAGPGRSVSFIEPR